jgi:hypothetical protein
MGSRLRGLVDSDKFFATLANTTEPIADDDRASARLRSRIYSRLLAEQAANGRLLGLAKTRESGRALCVFEAAIAHTPLPDVVQGMNPCYVCHARHLAERLERAPIFWPHCPYSEFHRG